MTVAMVGLGRMGFHMAERLLQGGFTVVGYNRHFDKTKQLMKKGAIGAATIEEMIGAFKKEKKIVWLMLPAGEVTDQMIKSLLPHLKKGDIIVNGANAFYKDAKRQSAWCEKMGVHLFDAGVSGGVHGLERGYALMIGGPKKQFRHIRPIVEVLAPEGGSGYFGPSGSGHFVKSVHNIVEYVFMEGLAEGAELLKDFDESIDVKKAFQTWQPASIVSSALLDWAVLAMRRSDFHRLEPDVMSVTLTELTKTVASVKGKRYAKAFDAARAVRCSSEGKEFVNGKRLIAGIRREFGGHEVKKKGKKR